MPRRLASLALIAAACWRLAGTSFAQDNYQFSDPNVENTFRYARMAIGGGVSKLKAAPTCESRSTLATGWQPDARRGPRKFRWPWST